MAPRLELGSAPRVTVAAENHPKQEPRPIRGIRGLVEALTAADLPNRISALNAIQAQPQAALAFGLLDGQDVIDILIGQSARREQSGEWANWVGTLGIFKDPRVTQFFLRVLETTGSPQMMFSAARYLAATKERQSLSHRLIPLLLKNDAPVRCRAITALLDGCPNLGEAATLRISLLSESGEAQPAELLATKNREMWLAELDGPFWREAQIHLRRQGEGAWMTITREWQRLGEQNQVWLLRWGLEEAPQMTTSLLLDALSSGSKDVLIEGLRALATLRGNGVPEAIESIAANMLEDADPEVREWAVHAAPARPDWRAFLDRESEASVRRACIPQLARSEGERAVPDLIEFLRSEDWQIRAQATAALSRLERDSKT